MKISTFLRRLNHPSHAQVARGVAALLVASLAFAVAACTELPSRSPDDPKDDADVLVTLRAATEDGKPESKISLANVLAFGPGATPERRIEAAVWYRRAAEQGSADGQFTLGLWLWQGSGVPKNRTEAVDWWRRAAEQGRPDAQYWLAGAYEAGEGGAEKDLALAARWYRRAAEQGNSEAQSSLGVLYAEGAGVPRDEREAVAWLRRSADQGCASGLHQLAKMYAAGRGGPQDDKEAARLFGLAAARDFTVSMTELGQAYERGRGVEKDRVCAYFWYGLAAKRGFSIGEQERDTLAPKLSRPERKKGERLVAEAAFVDGVLKSTPCPGGRP